MAGHSLLMPDPEGEGFVRQDLCAACHAALSAEEQSQLRDMLSRLITNLEDEVMHR